MGRIECIAVFILILAVLASCSQQKGFSYGLEKANELNAAHNTNMATFPADTGEISSMISEFSDLKNTVLASGQESFQYLVDYRIARLESERLLIENSKYGDSGTTKNGFGCKQRPLVIDSAKLRNASASKGFEAMGLLGEFLSKHPEDAQASNLTNRDLIFTNATFYQIYESAKKDSSVINNFCPESRVLQLYQDDLRKTGDYSEDYISHLDYEDAADVWKKMKESE